MIRSFKSKALKSLFLKGTKKGLPAKDAKRIGMILDLLDQATKPEDTNIPGLRFHGLQGRPKRYSLTVSGNWRLTFEWDGEDAVRVDYEDYH